MGWSWPQDSQGLVAAAERRGWRQGPRVDDWARVALVRPGWPGREFWLLARRRLSDGELAFYACFGPARTTLAELVRVAGIRWAVEECFQAGKDQVGLTTTRSAAGTPGIGT